VSRHDPVILHRAEWDSGLFWMVLLSALAHFGGLLVIALLPGHFTLRPRPVTAYVVDLVNSDQLAGTNVIPGSKGKLEAPPKVEPPPPPPKAEVKPPEPPPKEEVKPVEPQPPPKPEPKKEEPKPVEEKAVAVAPQPKPAEPTHTPVAQAKADTSKAKPEAVKAKPETKAAPVAAASTPAKKAPSTPAPSKEAIAARLRDEQLAKAIERVKSEGVKGGGTAKGGDKSGGGPISVGPGKGPGAGQLMGLEFVLYQSQVRARLKEAWAWAGANPNLEAMVRFRVGEDGEISDIRITKSSGDASYDTSVIRAVRAVSPLPPPPEAYRKELSDLETTFTPEDASKE
jgi:colicin import membrane protein